LFDIGDETRHLITSKKILDDSTLIEEHHISSLSLDEFATLCLCDLDFSVEHTDTNDFLAGFLSERTGNVLELYTLPLKDGIECFTLETIAHNGTATSETLTGTHHAFESFVGAVHSNLGICYSSLTGNTKYTHKNKVYA
jgi:hypothetical protein